MTTTYTQGPWSLQRNVTNYRSGRTSLEARGASDELIATFPGCDRDVYNARLIAAAPDLLKVAQNILADDLLPYLPAEYIAKVRAAITKATGG